MIDLMKLLETIEYPSDIRKLSVSQLHQLCEELREFIIAEMAENPGHLGASLGTVELAVAIHYVFNTPEDKLVWDVGHQAYSHKIITGRKKDFNTNRKFKGISGFPKIEESEYDAFGTGHSSTSISAVLGMAIGAKMAGNIERNHIAVIGDGAIGGGMAFEAMNQAGNENANVLIVLNDNNIAIDQSVGAVNRHLLTITASPSYNNFKNRLWHFLTLNKEKANWFTRVLSNLANMVKGVLLGKSNLFQSMGFRYFGPADGHHVEYLVKVLQSLKKVPGPKLLHVITVKGKGLTLAEKNQIQYHAPGRFNPDTGEIIEENADQSECPKFQQVFGETILELAKADEKVVGITPAMLTGCSLSIMKKVFPDRVFDVGIAEQHAVTFSAALAKEGLIPFCNIYSSFLQRAYDQIVHDVALQKLPVIFCIDRGGLVGEDGATHHGIFDLAFLRSIPNMIISSPMDEVELRNLLYTAYLNRNLPFAIRYPRGKGSVKEWKQPLQAIEIGKSKLLREGEKILVLSIGPLGENVKKAIDILETENISVAHVNMIFLKPVDEELLHCLSEKYPIWISVEDGIEKGGLFSALSEFLNKNQYQNHLYPIAINDQFVEHGDIPNLYKQQGFDVDSMVKKISLLIKNKS